MRTIRVAALLLAACAPAFAYAQGSAEEIEKYFTGKEVVLKLDMPGSQKGVDLKFNKSTPMDWKEYSSRLKQFGVAIRKGDTARVTSVVVKKDMIEFQLDGGGFGTFGDDTQTKVDAQQVQKTDYEKQLEKEISETDDPDRKRELQKDLDREQSKRQRQQNSNNAAAQVASQMKAQQVAENRQRGGSRFNLRWSGSIPAEDLTPDGVMKALGEYVDFGALSGAPAGAGGAREAAPGPTVETPATAQPAETTQSAAANGDIKRGMTMKEVTAALGEGKQLSASTSPDGLKTEVYEYLQADRRIEVTYVDGLVIRYAISSR